ncbi:MAG: NAD(P)H-hydrate dehydratase, partial [Endomicrobiia bacterium]
GSKNYTGAPMLAVKGSFSVGAGIVSLCVPENIYELTVMRAPLETIIFSSPTTNRGTFSLKTVELIIDYILKHKVTTLCIGCGMGIDDETKQLVNNLLELIYNPNSRIKGQNIYTIIDADGINLLNVENKKILSLKEPNYRVILTPHTGEYCRMTNVEKEKLIQDPCEEVKIFSQKNKVVTILKDAITTISDGEHIFKTNTPNSVLAKAGSGDVLAGMVAGLVYQIEQYNKHNPKFCPGTKSALLATYLHSQSGEKGAKEKTEFSFVSSDLLKYVSEVIKEIK